MNFTMGSLFAGIGGFDLGFERAGFRTEWQVEIDPYCQRVLQKHFPHASRFGDIRECGRHNLKPVDVICGGFPCQDISNAGKRAGIEGERSGLWSEYARIIRELRPKYVLVENVAALLGRGIGRVLGDLAEIGYDAEWEVISAADAGAPHLRERVWITGWTVVDDTESLGWRIWNADDVSRLEGWNGKELPERTRERSSGAGSSCAMADAEFQQRDRWSNWTCGWEREPEEALRDARRGGRQEAWMSIPESLLGRVAYGVPSRVDRLRGLGNAVVPQIPEMIARRIKQALETQRAPSSDAPHVL